MAFLLAAFPGLQPDDIRSTSMGASGEDLLLSPAAREVFPFSTECKNVESLNIWKALEQAAGRKHTPLVVFRRNNCQPHVALPLESFLKLLKDANDGTWQVMGRANG